MIAFLMGVPGKLTTLTNRLTSTWAAKLDTLATDYTTARAAKIDNLDAAITSRASASVWTSALASDLTARLKIPAASGLSAAVQSCYGATGIKPVGCNVYFEGSSTSYQTAYNYTGSGMLNFAAAGMPESGVTTATITLKITIDGVVVGEFGAASDENGAYVVLVGNLYGDGRIGSEAIPFYTSLLIQVKSAFTVNPSGRSNQVYAKVVKTS